VKILDRYIGRTVIGSTIIALLVLVGLYVFFLLIDELGQMEKGYGLFEVIIYIFLSMPRMAYQLFPAAALLGALLGLGELVANSEMTVMRAAGISLGRLIISVMKAAAIIMLMAMILGEFVAPYAEQLALHGRSVALANQIALKTKNGFWSRDGQSFINIRSILPGNRVEDIYIYEFDQLNRLQITTHAHSAEWEDGQWLLRNIEQTQLKNESVTSRHIDRANWESLLRPDLINLVVLDPTHLSLVELYRYISYLNRNGQNTLAYEQAMWSKLIYPFATAVMVFLAVPIVMGGMRTSSIGVRILIGALIGMAFHIINQSAGYLGVVFSINPLLSSVLPTLGTFLIALFMFRRLN